MAQEPITYKDTEAAFDESMVRKSYWCSQEESSDRISSPTSANANKAPRQYHRCKATPRQRSHDRGMVNVWIGPEGSVPATVSPDDVVGNVPMILPLVQLVPDG